MVCSMTAFARSEHRGDLGEFIWELRSVNHRFLEAFVRLPEELRNLEPAVRERLGKRLGRGKLDCGLRYSRGSASDAGLQVNASLVRQLIDACNEVGAIAGTAADVDAWEVLRWPGVLEAAERDLTPVQERALSLLDETLDRLLEVRRREGARLAETIAQRCASMRELVAQARGRMPKVLEDVRCRIRDRLQELLADLDAARLEQEMALLAQRLDIDEEMDRLASHLDEVELTLQQGQPVGRRLDFLMQELNREANTLGSKSNDVEITRVAVEMKVAIEQMREQVQNIE